MVEKIIVNPNEVRGYGNIMTTHSSTDYSLSECTIEASTDIVDGATKNIMILTPDFGPTPPAPTYIYQSTMTSDDNKWTASGGNRTVTYSSDGCTVLGAATSDGFYKLNESLVSIPSEFVCEFDITAATEGAYSESTDFVVGNISIRKQASKLRIGQLSGGTDYQVNWPSTPIHIKIEYGASTATVYVEGTSVGTWNTSYSYIGFKTYNSRSITIKNLEISEDSPSPTPTSYSLAFSQSTYEASFDGVTISCTLKDGDTPMSNETIAFSYETWLGPLSVSAVTNSSGVTTYTFGSYDFTDFPTTLTATYQGATTTCTIVEGL